MVSNNFLSANKPVICFAHSAYQFSRACDRRNTDFQHFSVTTFEELEANIYSVDVLVVSGFWRNSLLKEAQNLRYVQSISAGTDQYDKKAFKKSGLILASGKGVNANAVGQHAMALILSLYRQLHLCRDNQKNLVWRPMIGDPDFREDELSGKTILVIGLGSIGRKVADYANAFGMHVIATRRHKKRDYEGVVKVYSHELLSDSIPQADIIVLACPLTPETDRLIGINELKLMKQSAHLINVSRGKVVDEEALIFALKEGLIAGAGVDVAWEEPLPSPSPLWSMENVILTPHSGGETRSYEDNILDILEENLELLRQGRSPLRNQVF